ncbi:MAG: amidohydrolase family protein, partial [Thermoanaerobacteraceae bacterium]|nr:amidohydrolase family protein [Thermoanaerobacteraceae bacterium]
KVNPPLRTQEDINALLEGLKDGTIDAIATDHAPHHFDEKDLEFDKAAFGMVGLETALGVILTNVVEKKGISINKVIEKMTIGPAKVLGLDMGTLKIGAPADITVIDINREWVVNKDKFLSKGRNTPFNGLKLKGKAAMTIVDGNVTYSEIK